MCASLFLCLLKRRGVCDFTCFSLLRSVSSHQLARPRSAGSGSAWPYRPGCTLCVIESFWCHGGRPDPGPGLQVAPGLHPCHGRACSRDQPGPCRARHRSPGSSPALGRSASQRLRRSGSEFWTPVTPPLRGPVCIGDARFSQRDKRRSARCLPPLSIGSAVAVGLCSVSRRRPSIPLSDMAFRPCPSQAPPGPGRSAGRPSAEPKLFGSEKKGQKKRPAASTIIVIVSPAQCRA